MQDRPLYFHPSLNETLDTFRNVIASTTWLKASIEQAATFYVPYPHIIELPSSVTDELIKVDKSILAAIKSEGFGGATPLYSKTLVDFYRIFTST